VSAALAARVALGAALLAAAGPSCRDGATAPPAPAAADESAYRANNVGVSLLEQFRYEEAAASFRKALALRPTLGMARVNLAIALLNAQHLPEARTEAAEAARILPRAPQAHYTLALAARSLGATEDARAAFRRVLELDPQDVGARVNLGQLLMQDRRYPEAAEEFKAALFAEPYSATAAYNLGLALARAGRTAESQTAMDRFRHLREAGYGTTLGQSYPDQGRYAEAIVSTGAEAELVHRTPPPVTFVDVTPRLGGSVVPGVAKSSAAQGGGVVLADLDGDGQLDLFVTGPEGPRLYLNRPGRFEDATARWGIGAVASGTAAVAGDYDNDGKLDLLVLRAAGVALLHNDGQGLSDRTAAAGLASFTGAVDTAAFVDADHDGDLDVVLAGPAARRLLQNDGEGRFKDVTAAAGLSARAGAAAVVPTDFDNRRDVDLLFVRPGAPPELDQNRRDGTFRDVAAEAGLSGVAAFRCVAAGDVNKDAFTDFFFGAEDGADRLALSDGRGRFTLAAAPAGSSGSLRAQFLDYDDDGLLDLLALSRRGPRLLRNLGSEWMDVTASAFGPRSGPWPAAGDGNPPDLAAADLDGDGDTDLVLRLPSGDLRILDNEGGRNHALPVRLSGLVSNRGGTGAKVEMRAGSLQQKLETYAATPAPAPADLVFGLGSRPSADAVRVLWPSGVLQTELVAPAAAGRSAAAMLVKELDRKPSSCPFLYAWNGRRFEFVTDFMGGGEMGYWEAPGLFNHPDPDEYVRIRGDQLAARDGRYELRVTNELEEALFLDRLSLLAVAHPADVEVYPDEGMRASPPAFRLFAVRDLRPPRSARDGAGRDLLPDLRALDRVFAAGFALRRIRGYAEEHSLVLDLGPEAGDDTVLVLTGWTDYAFSSDNVAAHQAGLDLHPPRLETEDASGVWRAAVDDIGIPVGRPQTVVVPMAGRWRGPSRRVRIVTDMRIYWDQARVGTDAALALHPARLEPARADLRERGFSAAVPADGRDPLSYDYERVSRASPWKTLPGRYTRTGDVRELVAATDDMFVISPPGDEVAVSFEAAGLPALPAGWTRSYLLFADGFSKEMDIHSASPDVLAPLPYHGMPAYPYAPPAAYPLTPARAAYLERYNTRVVRSEMARLEAAPFEEARP
jgi:tetratricopeptide (TPR) repeat protein